MSNVWTAIACRAPCTSARAKPILQLFAGYARSQRARYGSRCTATSPAASQSSATARWGASLGDLLQPPTTRAFSTTALLAAREQHRPNRPPPAPRESTPAKDDATTLPDSPLEPAQTVASHTEGLPPQEDEGPTWRDYDPEGGMPIPTGELPQPDINAIFGGEEIDADTGNYILSVMHWRRMSGALIDSGLDFTKRSGVTRDQALMALQHVRTLVPGFNEQEAGQQWAEEESLRLQEEIRERSVKLGLYKPEAEDVIEDEEESQQGTAYGRERSSESQLQKHREEREAQWEQEQADKQAQAERDDLAALHSQRGPLELAGGVQPTVALTTTGPGGITIGQAPTSGWLTPVERKPWVKYYEEQAMIIKTNILPRISVLGRLVPSLLLVLAVMGLGVFVSDNYTPPPKAARIWPDTPPAVATLTALTVTLVGAFVASRLPPVWRTLSKYATIVPAYPYAASLLGAAFRHDTPVHLASNLAALWLFGLSLHDDVGRGTFLAIFLASSAAGGFASLSYNVLRKQWMTYIFGSSGGVLGVAAAACTLRPNRNIAVLGYEIPVAAWFFIALFGAGEAFAAVRGMKTSIDHAGHLGGIVGGVAAGWYLRERAKGVLMVRGEGAAVGAGEPNAESAA
ncbi:hypothetical protein LTR36_001089 [Oleoguttula mirabilis]|uniref:Peptidase S54 rhomboid domain-containing protein n=1 Tax=Oleoguttula mirabilis TaxID=1507867 RepID=A0AAV9JPX8_9PEZI|nr:hypothetical protein LTR36_001089 [Oleoguttula mirabilis]